MRKFIFFWFTAVGVISTIGAFWFGRSVRLAAGSFYESDFVHYNAQRLVHAFVAGGLPGLDDVERQIDPKQKLRFFVFDSNLREVTGRPAPEPVRALAARLRPQDTVQFDLPGGGLFAGAIAASQDGSAYRVVVRFAKRRAADAPLNVWVWSGRIGAGIVAAGLLCSWLAWRLSNPLNRLRQAARKFASGDLKARAGASTFPSHPPEYGELARDFDEMASRIEMLVDSQRRLLRDVSHELRTPLTRLNLAVNNARYAPAADAHASLDRIDQESERLNALIERIIRLSRCEAFAEPRRDTIEFADFIESIVTDADFEATACNRRVSIVRAEMRRLAGDRELLREAVENIVRNAIRYTPEGTTVTVDAYCVGPLEYRIAVRDSGPGVPLEHIESIFEPFYRAPQGKCQDSTGFGIGLAIAKRAIGLHQGTITACNLAEGGLEIAVSLPVPQASG